MSAMTTSPKRSLNNAGYPVQDRFAFDFGKQEEYEGLLSKEIDWDLF
jgi:hypothetical protein